MWRGRATRPALALLAGAAMAAAGCGDEGSEGQQAVSDKVEGVGIVTAGSTAQFANCRDWRQGTEEERYATIEDIRGQLTPQSSETAESDLSDDAAYRIFQHTCANDFADELRLYKLYARAQAFAPLTGEPPQ